MAFLGISACGRYFASRVASGWALVILNSHGRLGVFNCPVDFLLDLVFVLGFSLFIGSLDFVSGIGLCFGFWTFTWSLPLALDFSLDFVLGIGLCLGYWAFHWTLCWALDFSLDFVLSFELFIGLSFGLWTFHWTLLLAFGLFIGLCFGLWAFLWTLPWPLLLGLDFALDFALGL